MLTFAMRVGFLELVFWVIDPEGGCGQMKLSSLVSEDFFQSNQSCVNEKVSTHASNYLSIHNLQNFIFLNVSHLDTDFTG